MQRFQVPQGEFVLLTSHSAQQGSIRAWDSADELLLQQIHELGELNGSVLLLNDRCGALAVALASNIPSSLGDSYVAQVTTIQNLDRNGIAGSQVELLGSLDPLPEQLGYVFIKVPKTLALLEDQLLRLAPSVNSETVIIAAGMTKHIHRSTLALFERIFGTTTTSLAKKKSRLIFVEPEKDTSQLVPLGASSFTLEPGNLKVKSHPGVFSAERLDIGTSFFIDNLPDQAGQIKIIDLGCGNGVVGLVLALDNPDADVMFVDESYLAVASAELTVRSNLDLHGQCEFVIGDSLGTLHDHPAIADSSIDLVFTNPPFHDDHALSDATAWQMFQDAHRVLRSNGQLWVIGNRHLAYHAKLKRIFGNCDVVGSNSKFVVFRATRKPAAIQHKAADFS
jgi:16S rRNA (guanine1207-N2)-methyltransferase